MSYNHRSAEKAWLKWKEAEEKELRQLGMAEDAIQQLHTYDWQVFKEERNFRRWQSPEEDVGSIASSPEENFNLDMEALIENTENEQLLALLKKTDRLTLEVVMLWVQGYSTEEICGKFNLPPHTYYNRIRRFKEKIKKILRVD